MCPLVAGGNATIAGELCNPTHTLYELTHRLKDGPDGLKLFALLQVWRDCPPGVSFPASFKEGGFGGYSSGRGRRVFLVRRRATLVPRPLAPPLTLSAAHLPPHA